jgi:hypothetical protein
MRASGQKHGSGRGFAEKGDGLSDSTERLKAMAENSAQGSSAFPGMSHAWRALRHRNFRLFFGGQSISLIGTWMTRVATAWLVYRLTGSAILLGTVGFVGQISTFVLSPFAGVWVDRWNRRRVLLANPGFGDGAVASAGGAGVDASRDDSRNSLAERLPGDYQCI